MDHVKLHLDWCNEAAARYAVMHWHYSQRMPAGKRVRIGVWEDGEFVGVVIFGGGATPEIGKPFGLGRLQVCELVRVAMGTHCTPVSRVVAIALRMLRKHSPGIELVVSFADTAQGHRGGIYMAGGWVYVGSCAYHVIRLKGRNRHPKTLHSLYGKGGQSIPWLRANVDPKAERITTPPKHKYVMPLTDTGQAIVAPMSQPYPQRAGSADSGTPTVQAGGGGATPTPALSTMEVTDG